MSYQYPPPDPGYPPYPPPPGNFAQGPYDHAPPPSNQSYGNYPPPHAPPPPNMSGANAAGPGYQPRYDMSGPPPPQSYGSGPSHRNDRADRERGHGGPPGGGRRGGGPRGRSPDGRRDTRRPNGEKEFQKKSERWCRTLFVRNVAADVEKLRSSFSSFGEVKEFFDLISNRGLIFITYFDLRAADRARQAMHNTEIEGRPIDVHFSLPRDDDVNRPCTKEKNQGSILVTIRGNSNPSEMELGKMCERFGEVRSVRPARSQGAKVVEFWDSRGANVFFDQMQGQDHQGGPLNLRFLWDESEPVQPLAIGSSQYVPPADQGPRGGGGREESRRGPPSPVNRRDRGPPPGRGQSPPRRGSGPRGDDRRGSYGRDDRNPYADRYRDSAPAGPPVGDDRLEQARRVQDLLATLGGSSAPAPAPYPPARPPYPPNPPRPAPGPNAYGLPPRPPAGDSYSRPGGYPPPPGGYNPPPGGYNVPPPAAGYDYNRPPPPMPAAGPPGGYGAYPPPVAHDPRGYVPPPTTGYRPPPPPAQTPDVSSLLAMLKK